MIVVVDENDKPVGSAPKEEAQRKGLIHRVSQVIVEDPAGRILLQKRGLRTEVHPGGWDISVGGHVDENEGYLEAAKREMAEEIGLKSVKLSEVGTYYQEDLYEWRKLNRFYRAYKTVVPTDTTFKLDADEVDKVHWFTVGDVIKLTSQKNEDCTEGLIAVIKRFYS